MMTLSDLREPPVIGQFYLVPVVRYGFYDRVMDWPVLGPLHHDKGPINFPHLHYHLDKRFLTKDQMEFIARRAWAYGIDRIINGYPLAQGDDQHRKFGEIPRKPRLARRKCTQSIQAWTGQEASKKWGLQILYGTPAAPALKRTDGRMLCPHRKVDLSQIPADADGLTTCPLHGLRVDCRDRMAA
jgi:hypothetical protein